MRHYHSETSMDVEGTSHHPYEGENHDYDYNITMDFMKVSNMMTSIGLAVAVIIIWIVLTVMTVTHMKQPGVVVMTAVIYMM